MIAMEQKNNLKDEIVSAVVEHLVSFEERINEKFEKIDEKFGKVDEKFLSIDGQLRKQGVILEDVQGKVQLLVEGQDAIHERIDKLEVRVTALEER